MTRIELAKKGVVSEEVKAVAISEHISPDRLASDVAEGLTVIPRNRAEDKG